MGIEPTTSAVTGRRSNQRRLKCKRCRKILVCCFEGISFINKARWLSWLERRPVTAEVVGSIPIRVALFFE